MTDNPLDKTGSLDPILQHARRKKRAPGEYKTICLRECPPVDNPVDTPQRVSEVWREWVESAPWFDSMRETVVAFYMNTRRRLTGFSMVSVGTMDTALTHPREVFRGAIVHCAQAIILAHNHPSGDTTPSEADIKVTRDLIWAGKLLRIEMIDHVIVARTAMPDGLVRMAMTSLREIGYFHA